MESRIKWLADFARLSPPKQKLLLDALRRRLQKAIGDGSNTSLLELARIGKELNPQHHWWLYEYADGLRQAGRLNEAEVIFRKVYGRWPRHRFMIEVRLGQVYQGMGKHAAAERWLRKATVTKPNDTFGWIYLGIFYARRQRFDDACRAFEKAVEAEGDVDEALFNLAMNKRAIGDYRAAEKCLTRALRISPDYTLAARALADIRLAMKIQSLGKKHVGEWSRSGLLRRNQKAPMKSKG